MPGTTDTPAIDGWWASNDSGVPHLVGAKCPQCGTYVFPPRANNCPNPACAADELEPVALSRRGTLWSYTENHYAPPPPYPAADPFTPFAVAAVQLDAEGIIVLPHVGGPHPQRDSFVARLFVENLERFLDGRPLKEVVDRGAGY